MKILTNGHFISCDDENHCFSVMGIDRDKIVYTGDTVPEEYAECPAIDMARPYHRPGFLRYPYAL